MKCEIQAIDSPDDEFVDSVVGLFGVIADSFLTLGVGSGPFLPAIVASG